MTELDYDDFGLDEIESPFGSCSDDDDWDEDEWEEEEEYEPPSELTPEQREKMNKDLQRIFKEGKERGEEIWNRMNIKNSENLSYDKWLIYNLNKVKSI